MFKCDFDNAKSSFYRAFNAVYGKIGRYGSEEVILQLIYSKRFPCLFYAIEACPANKTQKISLEFTINRTLMKLFRTVSSDVIKECLTVTLTITLTLGKCPIAPVGSAPMPITVLLYGP